MKIRKIKNARNQLVQLTAAHALKSITDEVYALQKVFYDTQGFTRNFNKVDQQAQVSI